MRERPVTQSRAPYAGRASGWRRAAAGGLLLALIGTAQTAVVLSGPATAAPASPSATEPSAPTDSDNDGQTDQPDHAAASALAAQLSSEVEDLSARTESSTSIVNPDGSVTIEQYGAPIRVNEAEEGDEPSWVDINYDLEPSADGALAPVASPATVTVNSTGVGGQTHVADLRLDDGSEVAVTFSGLPGVDGTVVGTGSPSGPPLGDPVVEDGVAVYSIDGYSAPVDLVVSMTTLGFSVWLRLNEAPAAGELAALERDGVTFGVRTTGGAAVSTSTPTSETADEQGSGAGDPRSLVLTDSDGTVQATIPQMLAWQTAETGASNDQRDVVTLDVELDEPETAGGHENVTRDLTVRVPQGYLAGDSVAYPVVIDPQFDLLGGSQDVTIRNNGHASESPTSANLSVGRFPAASPASTPWRSEAYAQFDTTALTDKEILFAEVRAYQYYSAGCDTRPMFVDMVTQAWDQNSLTWSTRPTIDQNARASIEDNVGMNCSGDNRDVGATVDVTAMATEWAAGRPNYGMRFSAGDGTDDTHGRSFCSFNTSLHHQVCDHPAKSLKLTVTYAEYDDDFVNKEYPANPAYDENGNPQVPPTVELPTGLQPTGPQTTCEGDFCVEIRDSTDDPDVEFEIPTEEPSENSTDGTAQAASNYYRNPDCDPLTTAPREKWRATNRDFACGYKIVTWTVTSARTGKVVGTGSGGLVSKVTMISGGAKLRTDFDFWIGRVTGVGHPASVGGWVNRCASCGTRETTFRSVGSKTYAGYAIIDRSMYLGEVAHNLRTSWTVRLTFFGTVPMTADYNQQSAPFRCDRPNSSRKAGCVFPNVVGILEYRRSKFPNIWEHVRKAHDYGLPSSLTKGPYNDTSNRRIACPNGLAVASGGSGRSCDEYPFNSVTEGAAATGASGGRKVWSGCGDTRLPIVRGPRGWSRCFVPSGEQSTQGGVNSGFYNSQRIHPGDKLRVILTR